MQVVDEYRSGIALRGGISVTQGIAHAGAGAAGQVARHTRPAARGAFRMGAGPGLVLFREGQGPVVVVMNRDMIQEYGVGIDHRYIAANLLAGKIGKGTVHVRFGVGNRIEADDAFPVVFLGLDHLPVGFGSFRHVQKLEGELLVFKVPLHQHLEGCQRVFAFRSVLVRQLRQIIRSGKPLAGIRILVEDRHRQGAVAVIRHVHPGFALLQCVGITVQGEGSVPVVRRVFGNRFLDNIVEGFARVCLGVCERGEQNLRGYLEAVVVFVPLSVRRGAVGRADYAAVGIGIRIIIHNIEYESVPGHIVACQLFVGFQRSVAAGGIGIGELRGNGGHRGNGSCIVDSVRLRPACSLVFRKRIAYPDRNLPDNDPLAAFQLEAAFVSDGPG